MNLSNINFKLVNKEIIILLIAEYQRKAVVISFQKRP
jgi:hypothetical protein